MESSGRSVSVKVVHMKGCQATPKAVELVKRVARELHLPIELKEVVVTTPEEAWLHRHLGSPTIQVEGVDIDPGARGVEQFGLT